MEDSAHKSFFCELSRNLPICMVVTLQIGRSKLEGKRNALSDRQGG